MIYCNSCGTDNLENARYCDECGTELTKANQQSEGVNIPLKPSQLLSQPNISGLATDLVNAASQTRISNKKDIGIDEHKPTSSKRAKLIVERGGTVGREFLLNDTESNIGRWDADGGVFPDVDLDREDPEAKVSRRHARIICKNGQYSIEDLGSTNGTFINRGRRLLPGELCPINNNDEIIIGKTFLKFINEEF